MLPLPAACRHRQLLPAGILPRRGQLAFARPSRKMAAGRGKAWDERIGRRPLRGRDRRRRHLYGCGAIRRRRAGAARQGALHPARICRRRARRRRRCSGRHRPHHGRAAGADSALHARLDGRGQHAAHPHGCQDRPHHHRRLRGYADHHSWRLRPLGRPHRGRHQAPGSDGPRPAAGAGRAHQGRAGAGGLQGRCAARAGRRRGASGDPLAGRGRRDRGARGLLPLVLLQRHPRAASGRADPRERTRRLRHALERDRAGAGRIRARVDDRHQRLCRAHRQRLHHQPASPAAGAGLQRAAPGDAGLWRAAAGRGCSRAGRRHARMRARRRRHRQPPSRPAHGRRGHRRLRHGGHDLQGGRDPGRRHRLCPRAHGRPLPLRGAQDRGGLHRRRRRQHRRAGSGHRRAGRGTGERRREARSGLLRPRRGTSPRSPM